MKKFLSTILCMGMLFGSAPAYADSYVMHTVQPEDTYWKISQKYNKDLQTLQSMNNSSEQALYEGNVIKIQPVKAGKTISIQVDGKEVFADQNPYLENARTFVPIRSIAEALNIKEINWDAPTQTAILENNGQSIRLPIGSTTATINEKKVELDAPINVYNGRTFIPIRFVAEAFNCNVNWDSTKLIVDINTKSNYTEDLYWLSKIVEAEAKGEPYEGKLAVANVIINRKNSSTFPNTIKDVVFDRAYGFQFTPVLNGTIYNTASEESIRVAKQALDGYNNVGNCLYFLNPRISQSFWIVKNRTIYKSINQHDFYL